MLGEIWLNKLRWTRQTFAHAARVSVSWCFDEQLTVTFPGKVLGKWFKESGSLKEGPLKNNLALAVRQVEWQVEDRVEEWEGREGLEGWEGFKREQEGRCGCEEGEGCVNCCIGRWIQSRRRCGRIGMFWNSERCWAFEVER